MQVGVILAKVTGPTLFILARNGSESELAKDIGHPNAPARSP